jgi:hypothetical protein
MGLSKITGIYNTTVTTGNNDSPTNLAKQQTIVISVTNSLSWISTESAESVPVTVTVEQPSDQPSTTSITVGSSSEVSPTTDLGSSPPTITTTVASEHAAHPILLAQAETTLLQRQIRSNSICYCSLSGLSTMDCREMSEDPTIDGEL